MVASPINPVLGHIVTPWVDTIDLQHPLPEYPRPQMVREGWQNLNGAWSYAITSRQAPRPDDFPGQILVPYAIESALSGVKRVLQPSERLWYRRTFACDPAPRIDERLLLHFGAVDWECQVFVNNMLVGEHQGGYLPFTFDITEALVTGENELVVAVWDPTDSQQIQRGKQVLKPRSIWYTAVSGIWQTVWLEVVPASHIRSLKLTPDIDQGNVIISVKIANPNPEHRIHITILDKGKIVSEKEGDLSDPIDLYLDNPKLWSPTAPFLYDINISLLDGAQEVDQVTSYFGMRKFSLDHDSTDRPRFCLNNQPLFLYGPLDQGYWPDGLYTPPSDEAMRWELSFLKDAGFNMLRKHIKVEPARYYYYCDQLGLIVWQDMINGGEIHNMAEFLFGRSLFKFHDNHRYHRLGRSDPHNRTQFQKELQGMIDTLYNVVSIAVWVPFNEGWGQFDSAAIAEWVKAHDPTRLVDHASGWFDQGAGDFVSPHVYFKTLPPPPIETDRALVLSEFGGYSMNVPEHAWNPDKNFGYRKHATSEALTQAYLDLLERQLIPWIQAGCSAAIYTQTTDVEIEMNGFLTYDRKVAKMDFDRIRAAHHRLYKESPN